jgi:large subunit ribosomal protein L21e
LTKKPRERGKTGLTKILHEYMPGEKVAVKIDPSVHKGMPHRRFQGKIGVIVQKKGRSYVVNVTQGEAEKEIIVRPEHLEPYSGVLKKEWHEMSKKALRERPLTIPEVKKVLESLGEDKLDQFQRRSLDYASKFSRVEPEKAEVLVKMLVEKFGLEVEEAIQVVNTMPESIEEIRVFLAGGRKIVEASKLQEILNLLNEYRKKE